MIIVFQKREKMAEPGPLTFYTGALLLKPCSQSKKIIIYSFGSTGI
jgi:hypothetical protein